MGDELYYIACSKHLAFGYVDHPPLVAWLAFIVRSVFGESILAFRVASGLAGAGTVLLTARIARQLGGGAWAEALASLLILCSATFPALAGYYSMNAFDLLLVSAFILQGIRTVERPDLRSWMLLGIVSGIGLLNKYTFLVLGFSFVLALLLTDKRRLLASPHPYIGGTIALLVFLPHVLWQVLNDFPTREFIQNATSFKNISLSPLAFLKQLTIALNPVTFPIWTAGLWSLLRFRAGKETRYLGVMILVFLGVYIVQSSKFYYVVPVFPLLFAAGSVSFERWWSHPGRSWLRRTVFAAVAVSGLVLLPLSIPVLNVQSFVSYSRFLGLWDAVRMETWEGDTLPIHFVHRLGWPELVDSVAAAYQSLTEEERSVCGIVGSWYGPAAAVDHFGPRFGLPRAISGHNSYWTWGDGGYSGEVMIAISFPPEELQQFYEEVQPAGSVWPAYGSRRYLYVCRRPRAPFPEIWQRLRHFI